MSIDVMNLVWRKAPHSLITLLALADWSNDEGESFPSIGKLSIKSRQSERNCQYIIQKLKKEGFLNIKLRYKQSSVYTINLKKLKSLPDILSPKNSCDFSDAKIAPECDSGVQSSDSGVQNTPILGCNGLHPYTSHTEPSLLEPSLPQNPNSDLFGKVDSELINSKDYTNKKTPDQRHAPVRTRILEKWCIANQQPIAPWNGAEAKMLSQFLKSYPALSVHRCCACVDNRFQSEVNHAEEPRRWLGRLIEYLNGPLDKYSKPLESKNDMQTRSDQAIARAAKKIYNS